MRSFSNKLESFGRRHRNLLLAAGITLAACTREGPPTLPQIPKVWEDDAMRTVELPRVDPAFSAVHIPSDYYDRIPLIKILRTYPIYHPDKEPPGYIDELRQKEPEEVFDVSKLKTEEDWIRAGELVFDFPGLTGEIAFVTVPGENLYVRDRKWFEQVRPPLASDGTLPFLRYMVREKGKVEVGILACGMCHTRVMPDGSVVKGAQGNFPIDAAVAFGYRRAEAKLEEAIPAERSVHWVPWRRDELDREFKRTTLDQLAEAYAAIPAGVNARHGTTLQYPVQIPDLIGVKDRKYLDHTGLQLHRSIEDLMRYDALNTAGDALSQYGDYMPLKVLTNGALPDPSMGMRFSDAQLYALARFIYSLKPPKNPNPFDEPARRGQAVFTQEGCPECHTPPLYTNNTLIPVDGFEIPDDHRQKYLITERSVGTDPNLSLKTLRGTGYYKVPSLKGVWYRGPFSHDGSVLTLEEWFDPRRLRSDYVPTGFKGAGVKSRAVPGHPFGLRLTPEEKADLIAFLKTL